MDALLVFVTEGITSLTRRKSPFSRHRLNTGIWLCSRYSSPNPSHMITTTRCGDRWAKAGADSSIAPAARNSRRSMDEFHIAVRTGRAIRQHYGRQRSRQQDRNFQSLILDVLPQVLGTSFGPIYIACRIRRHAFRDTGRFRLRSQRRDEHFDCSVFGAADPDPLPHARVHLFIGLRIGHIHRVLGVDVNTARPAKLLPLIQKFSVLIENLDATITAVADEEPSGGIHGNGMGGVELARTRSL